MVEPERSDPCTQAHGNYDVIDSSRVEPEIQVEDSVVGGGKAVENLCASLKGTGDRQLPILSDPAIAMQSLDPDLLLSESCLCEVPITVAEDVGAED
ncbi:protein DETOXIFICATION 45, chloroplastic [Sesbania bispinosa]|nr:protein DETOXIFICATION 45, chloroplastic [Sesbania bispinosa]